MPPFAPARLALISVALIGCGYSSRPSTATLAPVPVASLDSVMNELMALDLSPGAGMVVVRDTQIVYMKGFGYADVESKRPFTPETAFYVASTTKSFTGLAAAILDRQGTFKLDAPLSRYLPDLRLKSPLNADSITIRSLLTHTHGIGNGGPVTFRLAYTGVFKGNDELIRLLAEHAPARTGRAFAYGNVGYNVAALAMDAATKESWKETLQRTLFTPLGMTKTSAYVSKYSRDELATPYQLTLSGFVPRAYGKTDANMQSAGGLMTTLRDMGTWLEAHINKGRLDGRQILLADAVAEAHSNLAPTTASMRGARQIGYGLGWNVVVVGNDTLLVHGGGFPGFSTHMSFIPSKKIGLAVFANNGEMGSGLVELAANRIYAILTGAPGMMTDSMAAIRQQVGQFRGRVIADLTRRSMRPQDLQYPLEAYTGIFENPLLGQLDIRLVNGKLEARMGAASSAIEVYDNTKNQLRVELTGSGEVVNVEMKDGRADVLTISGVSYRRLGP